MRNSGVRSLWFCLSILMLAIQAVVHARPDSVPLPSYLEILNSCKRVLLQSSDNEQSWNARWKAIRHRRIRYRHFAAYSLSNANELFPWIAAIDPWNVRVHYFPEGTHKVFAHGILSKEDEQALFHRMNFVKFRASGNRQKLPKEFHWPLEDSVSASIVAIENDLREAAEIRRILWSLNTRLVNAMAKRYGPRINPNDPEDGFEQAVEIALLRISHAIEQYRPGTGNRFYGYVLPFIWRALGNEVLQQDHLRTWLKPVGLPAGNWAIYDTATDEEPVISISLRSALEQVVAASVKTDRNRDILFYRHGLGENETPHTLGETGAVFKITRERVRQIEAEALVNMVIPASDLDLDELVD